MNSVISISSCLIIKNEMTHILDLIDQLCYFSDEVIIVDTGSTDGFMSPDLLASLNPKVQVYQHEWKNDFSEARNYSFSLAHGDYIFWCDGDDVLTDHLVGSLIEFSLGKYQNCPDYIDIPYQYWYNNPDFVFDKTRLIRRRKEEPKHIYWFDPIHEYLEIDYNSHGKLFDSDAYVIHKHKGQMTNRNLQIYHNMDSLNQLRQGRDLYYYGMELFNGMYFVPAYLTLLECVYSEEAWVIDRINAIQTMNQIQNNYIPSFKFKVKVKDAIEYLLSKDIKRQDIYCYLGDAYLQEGDERKALLAYQDALNLARPNDTDMYLMSDIFLFLYPAQQLVVLYDHIALYGIALDLTEKVLQLEPDNSNAQYNRNYLRNRLGYE